VSTERNNADSAPRVAKANTAAYVFMRRYEIENANHLAICSKRTEMRIEVTQKVARRFINVISEKVDGLRNRNKHTSLFFSLRSKSCQKCINACTYRQCVFAHNYKRITGGKLSEYARKFGKTVVGRFGAKI